MSNKEAQKKFDECVRALTALRYGPEGPPKNTTFAEIEEFGHEVGRMLGGAVDPQLTSRHAEQFQQAATCPTCQTMCEPKPTPVEWQIQTSDGLVLNREPVCRCSVCSRDFFPSASGVEDGRTFVQSQRPCEGIVHRGDSARLSSGVDASAPSRLRRSRWPLSASINGSDTRDCST